VRHHEALARIGQRVHYAARWSIESIEDVRPPFDTGQV